MTPNEKDTDVSRESSSDALWSLERITRRGAITDAQRRRIEAVLREDPVARRFYLEYLENHFVKSTEEPEAAPEPETAGNDFWSLVEMKFDGTMTPQQQQRFDAIMTNNPSAMRFYRAYTGPGRDGGGAMPVPSSEAMWELAAAHCDGMITAEQMRSLEALLEGDAANRHFYVAYLDQHAQLGWSRRGGGSS